VDQQIIGLSVALALAAGMVAQSLARHLRVPGIVLLLAAGVLLGPDVAGIVQPESLGRTLHILVGFAVAVILFEGGMNLNLSRLRHQARVIRRLLTLGALVTAAGGALSAKLLMGWDWGPSFLFGTLVIVTGPTVITPLLRRIKIRHRIATVLEAEGVLIDAIGAVAAVMALEIVISLPSTGDGVHWDAAVLLVPRLSFGFLCGLLGGLVIALLLRVKEAVPRGLENVFTLSLVLALFQLSNFALPESGIMTVTVAGLVVGNMRTRVQRDLLEFKEQLTVMLVGMLFVMLAAGVRLADVRSLGWPGVATVLVLMLVIRPLNVFLSTLGSDLTWRERLFLSWLAPRGIVAAAVASLFAQTLNATGLSGGRELQALVFLVIGVTVLVQGLTGGAVAGRLGLRRAVHRGWAILGANELGHAIGRLLRECGEAVIFLDSNPAACHVVEQDGFKVVYGNVLDERTLLRAQLDDRAACIAVTPNEEANLLFARRALEEFKVPRAHVAVARGSTGVNETVAKRAGASVLFGAPRDLELWSVRLRRGTASIEMWRAQEAGRSRRDPDKKRGVFDAPELLCLPLVIWRGSRVFPANGDDGVQGGDIAHFALLHERRQEARAWLAGRGWTAAYSTDDEPAIDLPPTGEPESVASVRQTVIR
jgi:NhaP-type Na+/H+ or K+/H+ antiporter